MKICAFSDMHGQINFKVEPCDIVLIGGDIIPLKIQDYTVESEEWFKTVFIPWCNDLPCEKVVFIAGNHDFFLMRHPDRMRLMLKDQDKIVYLDGEIFEYKGKVIFGTPWCKPFGRWAFMESYEEQDKRYARYLEIIGKVDIVLSHDAPYGVSDIILQEDCWWADGTHIGNQSLKKFLEAAKPILNIHGHLHTTNHNVEKLGDTDVYCVSILDENYEIAFEPQYFELKDD
jgi:Icc-related predicted phosphoesterase